MVSRLVLLLLLRLAGAQGTAETVPAADLLPGLIANAADYRATLPALICDEAVTSQELEHDKVKRQTVGTGVFRLSRDKKDDGIFTELHEWKTINGKEVKRSAEAAFPVFMRGAFANGLAVFFEPDQTQCFSYRAGPGDNEGKLWKMEIAKIPAMEGAGTCKAIVKGLYGLVLIDRATGHVVRMERRVPIKVAQDKRQPIFGAVDYAPVAVEGVTMWLPIGVEGIPPDGDLRFYSQFTNFRRLEMR